MPTKVLTLQPLGERLLVKALPEEEVTKGGVILPDTAKEKPQQGKVIAVGKGMLLRSGKGKVNPMAVKKGDRVLFGKYAGTDIKIDGEEHLIMREDDILAVMK